MVNYVKMAATAKRLIEANGRDVILVRKNRTPADAAKPWRGPTDATDIVKTVKAVIYPIEEMDDNGTLVRRGGEKAMIAHDSLATPEELQSIDAIQDGVTIYKVVKASTIGPGDVRVAYEFNLKS